MSFVKKTFKSAFGLERAEDNPSHFEGGTRALTDQMLARSRGELPSIAETQTKNNLDTSLNKTVSAIRSAPGLSPALRARMISRAGERNATDIVKQGAEARIAEQIGTERALGSILTGSRGQDINQFGEEQKTRAGFLKSFIDGAGQAASTAATGGVA